ncbi:hypothetical protein [Burkholderia oklahomensis]|uniref:hypothetical protein n=1 Tax=Burkholderia oklahomensis TaxID=342113 RepID=UPI00118758AA|nr:hypothetical protein [Burkholderia oklahomensis]QPS38018.1 hypothetical protein I6G57_04080 [Burkholderia oklahomensis]
MSKIHTNFVTFITCNYDGNSRTLVIGQTDAASFGRSSRQAATRLMRWLLISRVSANAAPQMFKVQRVAVALDGDASA